MSMKIIMVAACPYPAPQGSQALLRETALALRARGHNVQLLVYGFGAPGTAEPQLGLLIHRAWSPPGPHRTTAGPSFMKPVHDLALITALRKLYRTFQPDIVHAHNYEALIAALAARAQPIVYHAHNCMADELPYFLRWNAAAHALGRYLDTTFPHRADRIIVPHTTLADYLTTCGCKPEQLAIIPPCIDPTPFQNPTISVERPTVLYTGNLDQYQNLPLLMRAMDRVRKTLPDARLVIATADTRRIEGADHVYAPDLDALRSVLACDAVFACPRTSFSGYPMKLLNAMAVGRAIVACQSAAHPLTHNKDGLVVPDNDDAAFAAALIELLTNPVLRQTLGQNAQTTLCTKHSPPTIAMQIEEIYEGLGKG